jgi:hypothetical protein
MNVGTANNMEEIIQYIKVNELDSRSRKRKFVCPRNYLFYFLRYEYKMALCDIGKMFDRDHATVIHGIEMHENQKDTKDYIILTSDVKHFLDLLSEVKPFTKNKQVFDKIRNIQSIYNLNSINSTLNFILDNFKI